MRVEIKTAVGVNTKNGDSIVIIVMDVNDNGYTVRTAIPIDDLIRPVLPIVAGGPVESYLYVSDMLVCEDHNIEHQPAFPFSLELPIHYTPEEGKNGNVLMRVFTTSRRSHIYVNMEGISVPHNVTIALEPVHSEYNNPIEGFEVIGEKSEIGTYHETIRVNEDWENTVDLTEFPISNIEVDTESEVWPQYYADHISDEMYAKLKFCTYVPDDAFAYVLPEINLNLYKEAKGNTICIPIKYGDGVRYFDLREILQGSKNLFMRVYNDQPVLPVTIDLAGPARQESFYIVLKLDVTLNNNTTARYTVAVTSYVGRDNKPYILLNVRYENEPATICAAVPVSIFSEEE